jgi:hypothetical protein
MGWIIVSFKKYINKFLSLLYGFLFLTKEKVFAMRKKKKWKNKVKNSRYMR